MTDPQISVAPACLRLGELIERLEREDPAKVVAIGFEWPHSDRGDYYRLAFELRRNVTVGSMLAAAQSALGSTYEGYKGGDFRMNEHSEVQIVSQEGRTGEDLGALLLEFMLATEAENDEAPAPKGGQS